MKKELKENIDEERVAEKKEHGKRVFLLNRNFEFFDQLENLILTSSPTEKDDLLQKVAKIGRIKLLLIRGIFLNRENKNPELPDMLIVGDDIQKRKLHHFIKIVESEVGAEIHYAVMDTEEFQYRRSMFDRFIRIIFESKHEKLINKLGID
jgi:hypothetical protein